MAELAPRFRWTVAAHAGRALLGPLDVANADALLARVTPSPPPGERPAVLDVGCGKGEILVRAMVRLGATGTGVDPNPAFVADARARAAQFGREGDLTLVTAAFAPGGFPHAAWDLVVCTGASHAFGGDDPALVELGQLARANGVALFATPYWRRPPARGYLAAIGAREDEMRPLAETLAAPAAANWRVAAQHVSTPGEWDAYEHGYAAALGRWLEAHAGHVDAPEFRRRIDAWAAAYERWGRETMGYVTLLLSR